MLPLIFSVIIIASLAFLITHALLMRRLNRVEEAALPLEDALRDRLDLIVEWAAQTPDADNAKSLTVLCEGARDAEPDAMIRAWPKIDRLFTAASKDAPGDSAYAKRFEESELRLRELAEAFNDAVAPYNALLAKYPWKLYAGALMIKKEKEFKL